jgi:hypothetical protein
MLMEEMSWGVIVVGETSGRFSIDHPPFAISSANNLRCWLAKVHMWDDTTLLLSCTYLSLTRYGDLCLGKLAVHGTDSCEWKVDGTMVSFRTPSFSVFWHVLR